MFSKASACKWDFVSLKIMKNKYCHWFRINAWMTYKTELFYKYIYFFLSINILYFFFCKNYSLLSNFSIERLSYSFFMKYTRPDWIMQIKVFKIKPELNNWCWEKFQDIFILIWIIYIMWVSTYNIYPK